MGEIVDPLAFGKKLSDSVFEFYKPKTVHLEVVFIHGLEQAKCGDAYWKTWARDGIPENLWPRTWLSKEFPSARVLALSYDASIKRTATDGRMDLFLLGENLIQEMVDFGRIGQHGVPVVFVCHGFGGLVAKQIVVSGNKPQFGQKQEVKNLLQNIDAFCFYSTPHHGSHLAKSPLYLSGGTKSPLLENFKVLDKETGRLNQEFELFKRPSWHFHVVAESHEILKFREMVVAEASSRYGNATHMTLNASYVDICKPSSEKDSSYQWLTMHLKEVLDRNLVSLPLAIESLALESLVRFQEQEESVEGMLQEFRIVGLVGMGGSGKTTLAKVVYQSICSDFEKSSYLDDVKSKGTLDEVLVTLLRQFGIKNRKTGVEAQLSDFQNLKEMYLKDLKTFVKEHKVLVVVDDVGSEENFNDLLACMDFINGREDSRMIVTCREWQLLRKRTPLVGKYEMKLLNGSGLDLELFSHHVYKGAKTELQRREWLQEYLSRDASGTLIGDFESVFNDIVDACAGLPLSLEVMGSCIGSYLRDCDVSSRECLELWRGALQKFSDAAQALDGAAAGNERLWKSLRISYDDLGPSLQEKFLDVACFFCGSLRYDYNSLLRIWGGRPSDRVDLKNLQDRCLFKVKKEDGVVTMHDQLRDMGRSIVRGDGEYMTRVWTDQDVRRVLQSKESRATLGLSLGDWNKASEAIMRGKAHETSNSSEILFSDFRRDKPMELNCPNLRLFDLPEVKDNICTTIVLKDSSSVQWVCLREGNITKVPKFVLKCIHLCTLDLHGCQGLKELSQFVGNLVNLLELNLRDCQNLRSLPSSIRNLVKLSSLDLRGCGRLTYLPQSIGNLVNLSSLDLRGCGQLIYLPQSIGNLVKLSSLDLGGCESLTSLPASIGNLVNLLSLNLHECGSLTSLPPSIGNFGNLSSLDLRECGSLTSLPPSIGNFDNLSSLHLGGCTSLTSLPPSIGNFVNLSSLDLRGCGRLSCLPESIGNLVKLSSLDLGGCESLTCLPTSIGNFGNLSSLHLGGCKSLTCLPAPIGNLVNLSSLDFGGCTSLTSLPPSIGNLVNLSSLDLGGCTSLTSLPPSIGNLVNLSSLDLRGCGVLSYLPASIGNLVNLSSLDLWECGSLTSLPASIGNLLNLSRLILSGCTSLTSLPPSIGNFRNLSSLDLHGCGGLSCLPESIGNLVKLSSLDLGGCESLTSLPASIGNLVNLSSLILSWCTSLTSLPASIGNLVNLLSLILSGCTSLTCLPPSIGNFGNLLSLDLRGCGQLSYLPESIGNFGNLSSLELGGCKSLTSLPQSIGNLVKLSSLDLGGCKSLTCLPASIGNLVNLSNLDLGGCESLTCLPASIGNLVNLSSLDLRECGSLTSLPPSIGNLVNLSSFILFGCTSLTSLPPSIVNLVNLSSLDLCGCGGLSCLPESIGNLVKLSSLDLGGCESLTCPPTSIGNLVKLSRLDLRGSGQLTCQVDELGEGVSNSSGNVVNSSSLDLDGCGQLTSVGDELMEGMPNSSGNVVTSSSLDLDGCGQLTCQGDELKEGVSISSGNLVNLSSLDLDGCGQLTCQVDELKEGVSNSSDNVVNSSSLNLDGCGQLIREELTREELTCEELTSEEDELEEAWIPELGRDMDCRVGVVEEEGGRRPWSGSKHFYNFLVMFFILLEPLSNAVGFLTNYGCFVSGLLLQWVRIATGTSGQQVSSRYKSKVKSKELTLGSFLGQGCSGMLYEITWSRSQENTGRLARKLFPDVKCDVFESEVVRLFELTDHPNIVKIFCWTVDNRSCSLIMEFVSDNLSNVIRKRIMEARRKEAASKQIVIGTTRSGPFQFSEAIQIVVQIAKGIRHLHGQNIYHGDLKPNNVLIDGEIDSMSVKLADFGLVKTKRRTTLVSQRTLCSHMIAWSAPEIVEDYISSMSDDLDYLGVELDIQDASSVSHDKDPTEISMEKADTYSFALLCAYVFGGRVWDANLSSNELRKQTSRFGLRPKLPSECPDALASLISLCWDADPKRRPTFSFICDKLEEIVKDHQREKKGKYPLEQPEENVRQRARPVGGKFDA